MNDKYEIIWKEGSFFEKGQWQIVKKDDSSGQLVAFFVIGAIIFLVLCITAMTLALIAPLFVLWQMQRQLRYIGAIAGIIGFLYFLIDIENQWISSILFFGWTSESGEFNEGVLGIDSISIFWKINILGLVLCAQFIIQHLISEKKLNFISQSISEVKKSIDSNRTNPKAVQAKPIKPKTESPKINQPKNEIKKKSKTAKGFTKKLNIIGISVVCVLVISATIFVINEHSEYNQLSQMTYGKPYSDLSDYEKNYIEILSTKNGANYKNQSNQLEQQEIINNPVPNFTKKLPETEKKLVINGDNIWVRNTPSNGDVVMNLNKGDSCLIITKCCFEEIRGFGDYWYNIKHKGQEGWVFGSQTNLTITAPENELDCDDCHIVQDGESVYAIAEMYSLKIEELNKLNPQLENGFISQGMKLTVIDNLLDNNKFTPFYIINTLAVKDERLAKQKVAELSSLGYDADYLWIPDYNSLSGNNYFSVYIGPFHNVKECAEFIDLYRKKVPTAYGQKVSNDGKRIEIRGVGKVKKFEEEEEDTDLTIIRDPDPRKDFANVFWKKEYTLFDKTSDEPIFPENDNNKLKYKIYYTSNEDPIPYYGEFSEDELEQHRYYKFKTEESCIAFCDKKKKAQQ